MAGSFMTADQVRALSAWDPSEEDVEERLHIDLTDSNQNITAFKSELLWKLLFKLFCCVPGDWQASL